MTESPMSTLDAKLQMIRMLIEDIEHDEPNPDDEVLILHHIMGVYERVLLRSTRKRSTTLAEVLEMDEAVKDGNKLLATLIEQEAEEMAGWYNGIHPKNKAMALANLISRMTLEIGKVVRAFRFRFPKELNPVFNQRLAQCADEQIN